LAPAELKITLQLPAPADKVIVQFVSAPVMATVPVGVAPDPLTATLTETACPVLDGFGVWAVIVVVVVLLFTT
jgi:hypothetical protein